MDKRFAIVIGVAAAGAMALGAQTATAAPEVVKYRTQLSITTDRGFIYHGWLVSYRDRNPRSDLVRKCMEGRRVTVFEQRPGTDRELGTARTEQVRHRRGYWGWFPRPAASPARVYAKVRREVHDEFVCRGDREAYDPTRYGHPRSLGAQTASSTTGERVDRVPPDLRLSGAKTQHATGPRHLCDSRFCDVIVEVSCGDETCTERSTGTLTKVKNDKLEPDGNWRVAPGETLKGTGPEMSDVTQRKQVRKALNEGKNVKAKVTVRAWDAAGNVATRHRTITFK